jgi:amino acid permease
MASAGLIPGVITCALSGSIGAFGLYLLSLCATRAKHRHASFHAISKLTFPRAAVFFDAAIATKCFGVSIRCNICLSTKLTLLTYCALLLSYLIIIKGLMPNVVASLYHDLTSPTTNPPSWALNGNNWIIIFMAILVPLCFLRDLNSLRHTSYIALFSVGEYVSYGY